MIRRLQVKFVCIIMAVVLVMLAVIFGLVLFFTQQGMDEAGGRALQLAASEPVMFRGPRDNEGMLPYFIMRRDFRGNLLVIGTYYYENIGEEDLQKLWELVTQGQENTGYVQDYSLRYMRLEGPVSKGYVFVDISSHELVMRNLARASMLVGSISIIVFLGVAILLARWAVRPVAKAWQQQRQFVADASHELKTPLTVIMTNAELLQEPCDEASRQRFADSILIMSRQMRGLVERMLQLARADSGRSGAEWALLDMSRLVQETVLLFEPVYFEKGLALESTVEPGITLSGSESHLRQVLEILLDNGQKYCTPGGSVLLELKRQGRTCQLCIANPGRALTAQQCKDIFRRFYRVDEARSMDHSYGLGLAIAQRIVSDHRGRIWAESNGGMNRFYVWLPM